MLLDNLRARVPLGPASRVLDLACGTGQIAFALAAGIGEVWAVDQEAESVEFARRKAECLGSTSIRWIVASAEEVVLDGSFDLVAIGNAFQRVEREVVANRLLPRLPEGGCVALLWSDTPTQGDHPWPRVPHRVRLLDVALNRDVLGNRADEFERNMQDELLNSCSDGVFAQQLSFAYELARHTP